MTNHIGMKTDSEVTLFPRPWHLKSRLHLESQLCNLLAYMQNPPQIFHTHVHNAYTQDAYFSSKRAALVVCSTLSEKPLRLHSLSCILVAPALYTYIHPLTQTHTYRRTHILHTFTDPYPRLYTQSHTHTLSLQDSSEK